MSEDVPQSGSEAADRLKALVAKANDNARFHSLTRPQELAEVYAQTRRVMHELAPQADEVGVEEALKSVLDPMLNMLIYDVSAIGQLSARVIQLDLQVVQLLAENIEIKTRLHHLET